MTLRRRPVLASLLLAAALSGCSGDDNGAAQSVAAVGPSPIGSPGDFVSVSRGTFVQPTLIAPVTVPGAFCPAFPPFIAPFSIVFEGDGRPDRFFSQVHVQFVDRFGFHGGSMFLRRPELVSRFGSIALPAFGRRAFPLTFPFGCVGAARGVLTVLVITIDGFGRETLSQVQVTIH